LTAQKDRQVTEQFKDALLSELIEKSKVPVPDILVQDQMRSIQQDFERNLMYQGLSVDSYISAHGFKDEADWQEKEVRPTALKRVQAGLVLAELTKQEKITVTDPEIDEHVEVHKRQVANDPDAVAQLSTPEARQDITNHYLTEKTVEWLVNLYS
jgi:trigger factor